MNQIPMSSPDLSEVEVQAVHDVLSTRYLSLGPKLAAFERALAGYVGASHGVGVNSGTSGLHLCIIAADVGPGDVVITTPFSFIASANCILYEGGTPVFVDVDPETGNIDPRLIAKAARDFTQGGSAADRWLPPSLRGRRTRSNGPRNTQYAMQSSDDGRQTADHTLKAILPVHAFGQPADMDPIVETAEQYGLSVIEDACEALGAEYKGRRAGTLGDAAVFAFYPNKQITTGEGGMIVTEREGWAALCRSLRNQGRDIFDAWLNHTRLGYNYRLDEMSAALGLAQLARADELLQKRARVAGWYNERLVETDGVVLPGSVPTTTRDSWFVYVVRIEPPAERDAVLARLADAGIPSRPYFTPIHLQPFYRERFGYERGYFPVTERLGDTSLALPFSSVMTEEQVDLVCGALREAVKERPDV